MVCIVLVPSFQSTLPRGSDHSATSSDNIISLFQSTLPRGSDQKQEDFKMGELVISIHAPSRERPRERQIIADSRPFQSTLPRGSDLQTSSLLKPWHSFQSTLPRGSDPVFRRSLLSTVYFNPRSLAGATAKREVNRERYFMISIHAPSRERLQGFSPSVRLRDFNPRSLAGATLPLHILDSSFLDFNPRSLAGATSGGIVKSSVAVISIHAPLRERLCFNLLVSKSGNFNPRSLAGATCRQQITFAIYGISIHAPLRERRYRK